MREVHWLSNHATPYNDFLFRSLATAGIELTVHFVQPSLASHPWQSAMAEGFRSRCYRAVLGLDWHLLGRAILARNALFIVGGWIDPTMIAVANLLMFRQQPFAIWTDTPDLRGRRSPAKALLRKLWVDRLFSRVGWAMATGRPGVAAMAEMGCPPGKLVNFPFFIDLDRFSPSHRKTVSASADAPLQLISSGRLLNSHKGYDLALRALAVLRRERPALNFLYRIAGTGPDQSSLEAQARELGIADAVQFCGWLEPEELPPFYRSADLFIHPSHFDPFPNAVLEAMACGLPVLGSDAAGSVLDRVQNQQNGLVHRAGDVADLAAKLIAALDNRAELARMGEGARRTAEEWPVSRAIVLIREMLEANGRAYNDHKKGAAAAFFQ